MSPFHSPIRGQVYEVDIEGIGRKLWLVVSNNGRNSALDSVLAVRFTTSEKKERDSIVRVDPRNGEQFNGRILCDDVMVLYKEELGPPKGGITKTTMRQVDLALAAALGLDLDWIARQRRP
ncbi:MAG: type II toxin-antitoxin system PemK/MazF family toxin [Longispora sp.]|nr:type II toxin-antitoxin system PemK/MazF family toxin [Longispora sp. (in: high G+C Gram-positive bacteria)]